MIEYLTFSVLYRSMIYLLKMISLCGVDELLGDRFLRTDQLL